MFDISVLKHLSNNYADLQGNI